MRHEAAWLIYDLGEGPSVVWGEPCFALALRRSNQYVEPCFAQPAAVRVAQQRVGAAPPDLGSCGAQRRHLDSCERACVTNGEMRDKEHVLSHSCVA